MSTPVASLRLPFLTFNQRVVGSIPTALTNKTNDFLAAPDKAGLIGRREGENIIKRRVFNGNGLDWRKS